MKPQKNLTVVEGSVLLEADMERAFKAAGIPVDAVLQFLNPHRASDHPWAKFLGPPRLLADATAHAAKALSRQLPQVNGRKCFQSYAAEPQDHSSDPKYRCL